MEIETLANFKITSIQLQKTSLKPNPLKTLRRKDQLSVSKAFDTSILCARLPPKLLLSRRLTASEAKAMQSLMFLPLMKPLCSLEMRFGRITDNLSAKIFEMILNLKFARAIRRYWSIESALEVFVIRVMVLTLKFGSNHPVLKNSKTAFSTSS